MRFAQDLQDDALIRYLLWVRASSRVDVEGAPATGSLITFWHESMLYSLVAGGAARKVAVFMLRQPRMHRSTRLVERLGFSIIVGDRANAYGIREIRRFLAQQGAVVAITLDGPDGPRRVAKPAVVRLARLARAPLHPVEFSARALFESDGWSRSRMPDAENQITVRVLPAVPQAASVPEATQALQDALSAKRVEPAGRGFRAWPAQAWARASTMPMRFGKATFWPNARSSGSQDGLELRS